VGLFTLALALLVLWGYAHWLNTRTFTLVDKPVLLEAGRIQTENFEINLREDYLVQIEVHYRPNSLEERDCSFRWWEETDWKVYRLSGRGTEKRELWASSAEILKQGEFPVGFRGKPGKYQMEWSVPSSQACLNGQHARLFIYTSSLEYEEFGGFLVFVCTFLSGTGIVLVLRATGTWVFDHVIDKRPPRMFPEMELQNIIPRKEHRTMPLICDMSNFRVVWGGVLFMFATFFATVTTLEREMIGLPVDFREQKAVGVEKSPWAESVSVYVDGRRRFLVNGQPVLGNQLKAKLQQELSKQMVWTVYLEADSDCLFMDVVHAMDTIQGLGTKLVWITPKTREEWKQKSPH